MAQVFFITSCLGPPVLAISNSDLESLYKDTVWYNPSNSSSSSLCGSTDVPVGGTLPSSIPEPYNSLITSAAAASKMNPQLLAAIFLSENANTWKPFDTAWATSGQPPDAIWPDGKVGARGPFQFEPGTWEGYKADGNDDGVIDPDNMYDAVYSAAKLLGSYASLSASLGSIETPFKANTMLESAAAYNWGPGNIQKHTSPSSPITGDGSVPVETQNYINNVYALITSNFTKAGNPNYGDPSSVVSQGASSATAPTAGGSGCSGGIVAGSIVRTALNLAWSTDNHGFNQSDAKPEYIAAKQLYNKEAVGEYEYSDCGVFVATVMRASGADMDYVSRGTSNQLNDIKSRPDKYEIFDTFNSIGDLKEGDILINSQHTYIFTGQAGIDANGHNAVGASLHVTDGGHVPEVSDTYFNLKGEHFLVVRLK